MRKSATLIVASACLAVIAALWPAKAGLCSGDPWYDDGNGHWATKYIRVLWEEGVTDGEESPVKDGVFYFRPDSMIKRAQYVVLLCKVFQLSPVAPETPSYPDVPKTYEMLNRKPVWEFIEGALAGGISLVPPGSPFKPDKYTPREEAVAFLVRSLDLEPYAASMAEEEVQSVLRQFRDWREVSPERANAMACAVQLGILEGYDDGDLKPLRNMSRAEAATVVARSCLIRLTAEKDVFSPDGDGIDESVDFRVGYLRNRGVQSWQATIYSESGAAVRSLSGGEISGEPPLQLTWDGTGDDGEIVPRGMYYYQASVKDRKSRRFSSVAKPLFVETHSLEAGVSPYRCPDGRPLLVSAGTTPQALEVTVTLTNGAVLSLSSTDKGTSWSTDVVVGPHLPLGRQPVIVTAVFQGTTRSTTVYFERVEDLWLAASVLPNPAGWGQSLALTACAPPSVTSVMVELFGEVVDLSRGEDGVWRGSTVVPPEIEAGFYPAVFTAETNSSTVSALVEVEVREPGFTEIVYFLSK